MDSMGHWKFRNNYLNMISFLVIILVLTFVSKLLFPLLSLYTVENLLSWKHELYEFALENSKKNEVLLHYGRVA